jgi:hypothetical protein
MAAEFSFEFTGGQAIFESLDAVDEDDGNLPAVPLKERRVRVYVDFFERVFINATSRQHLRLRLLAQMAARSCVEYNVRFSVHNKSESQNLEVRKSGEKKVC